MPTILPFDDLEPGRFVTIHSRRASGGPRLRRGPSPFGTDEQEVHVHLEVQQGWLPQPGVPLKILALNAPFVMVAELRPGGVAKGPIYLDTRGIRLMPVPEEMIDALKGLKRADADPTVAVVSEAEGLDDPSDDEDELPF